MIEEDIVEKKEKEKKRKTKKKQKQKQKQKEIENIFNQQTDFICENFLIMDQFAI